MLSSHEGGVPGGRSELCTSGTGRMIVRHVLLICQGWRTERERELNAGETDMKRLLGTKEGAARELRMVKRTGILEQFKKAKM
jgi:hypothetical protein